MNTDDGKELKRNCDAHKINAIMNERMKWKNKNETHERNEKKCHEEHRRNQRSERERKDSMCKETYKWHEDIE